jgi:hypothetical protein
MKFAKITFWVAGIWGIVILSITSLMLDTIGQRNPPAVTHPEFFYGFISVAMVFQVVFLMIGSDPARFRPIIIPSILEKLGFVAACGVLCAQGRITTSQFAAISPDFILGILFVAAFFTTRPSPSR